MKKNFLMCAVAVFAASASVSAVAAEENVLATAYPGDAALIGWGGDSSRETVDIDGRQALKVVNPVAKESWEVQLALDYTFSAGTEYFFSFDVKGEAFEGISNGFQCTDGYAGCGNCSNFSVTADWNTVTVKGTPTDPGEGKAVDRWVVNMGKYEGTFYISNFRLYTKEQGEVTPGTWMSLIEGGVASEGESASIQAGWNGNAKVVANPAGEGVVFEAPIAADPSNPWDSQLFIVLKEAQQAGTVLKVSFDFYCTDSRSIDTQAQGAPGAYHHWQCLGTLSAKPEWQTLNKEVEVTSDWAGEDGFKTIAFNLASVPEAAIFYVNNVVVEKKADESGVQCLAPANSGRTVVYSLTGVKVLDTEDESAVNSLPKGIYIVNGKKIAR